MACFLCKEMRSPVGEMIKTAAWKLFSDRQKDAQFAKQFSTFGASVRKSLPDDPEVFSQKLQSMDLGARMQALRAVKECALQFKQIMERRAVTNDTPEITATKEMLYGYATAADVFVTNHALLAAAEATSVGDGDESLRAKFDKCSAGDLDLAGVDTWPERSTARSHATNAQRKMVSALRAVALKICGNGGFSAPIALDTDLTEYVIWVEQLEENVKAAGVENFGALADFNRCVAQPLANSIVDVLATALSQDVVGLAAAEIACAALKKPKFPAGKQHNLLAAMPAPKVAKCHGADVDALNSLCAACDDVLGRCSFRAFVGTSGLVVGVGVG